MDLLQQLKADFRRLGIREGDTVMMHCSYKSLGAPIPPAAFFDALLEVLGSEGTLVLPAFSYDSVDYDHPLFDRAATPSCVGFLPEYFRTQVPGVVRSLHATHSCTAKGRLAHFLTENHELDLTPVGPHSPITKLPEVDGKILILGSHPDHNTALHGVEERGNAPYIFNPEKKAHYQLKDGDRILSQVALRHEFERPEGYYAQKYHRILPLLSPTECRRGKVLQADCYLLSSRAVWEQGVQKLQEDPYFFVDWIPYNQ